MSVGDKKESKKEKRRKYRLKALKVVTIVQSMPFVGGRYVHAMTSDEVDSFIVFAIEAAKKELKIDRD